MKWYALLPIVAFISIGMRTLPFVMGSFLRKFAFLHRLSVMLPLSLLVIITAYTLHDVNFKEAPFGMPELIALVCVIGAQLLFRVITLSMIIGVICHQLLRMLF